MSKKSVINPRRPKKADVKIIIDTEQLAELISRTDKFKDHREVVKWLFLGRNCAVINFMELRYYYYKKHMEIHGEYGVSILSL